ncbi:MAG: 5'/3'-nucleotidase SurE [Candidatus Thorarchaeota archaeon]
MSTVCLVNDDGPQSVGLLKLAEALADSVSLTVIVPDGQRSGTGKALTLDRPIRITERTDHGKFSLIAHDGLPADSVVIALSMIEQIDLFVSGMNAGANLGYHRMFTSGTVGAALEAALQGYPAIAVSLAAPPEYWFTNMKEDDDLERICDLTRSLVERVLERGLPSGIKALNVNYPKSLSPNSGFVVSNPTTVAIVNRLEERKDPYGGSYYWIRGGEVESRVSGDALEVLERGNISISPIMIQGVRNEDIENLRRFLKDWYQLLK